jgi:ATP-dependent Clp protease ATP-binding subunit ClpA
MALIFLFRFYGSAVLPPNHANTITSNADYEGVCDTQNAGGVLLNKTPMNTASNSNKLTQLHELDSLLAREIRGQGQVLPRIISTVKRGELNLTKPGRPRGSFLLLGPTGVGKTETVVVLTNQIFGAQKLFRFDMSEFQTQESLGLLLGAKLGETGHLGAVRERAAEGSLLFDEAEKAHPRVLDIMLQLLDAAYHDGNGTDIGFQRLLRLDDFQHRLGGVDEPATFQRRDIGTPRSFPRATSPAS